MNYLVDVMAVLLSQKISEWRVLGCADDGVGVKESCKSP
jgi:hypothetical protein